MTSLQNTKRVSMVNSGVTIIFALVEVGDVTVTVTARTVRTKTIAVRRIYAFTINWYQCYNELWYIPYLNNKIKLSFFSLVV